MHGATKWNSYSMSHGKSACDGIGGTVKRLIDRISLQAGHITTPIEMYNYAKENIKILIFLYFR